MKRFALQAIALAGILLAGASDAQVRTQVTPYLEVQQVLTADLNGGGDDDVLTYTSVAAGVDATIATSRIQGQVSYRYERRISWNDDLIDQDVHSGIAAVRVQVVPKTLVFDAGAIAARARADASGPVFGVTSVNDPNSADVYGAYAGPSLTTHVGGLDVAASYRLGYIHVDDNSVTTPGAGRFDRFNHSVTQDAAVSVGMKAGDLPVGWTVGAGYVREDVDRLDQKYEGKYVRGDVVVPLSGTFALTGGVGYEEIHASVDDILRDSNGIPVTTPGGNAIPDPSRPRLLAYDQDGMIWDAGVIYRPSRRTELQARVGERYGSMSYTGSLRHEFNSAFGVTAVVYDSVDSFGRLVVSDLKDVPTNFAVNRNPLNGGLSGAGGCLFGNEPGSGVCFGDALQSIAGGNFRNRGANILFSGGRGPWSFDFGAGYANRRYYVPGFTGSVFVVDRIVDESWTVQADLTRKLSRTSSFGLNAYAAWYDSDFGNADESFGAGLTASYNHSFLLDRLQFEAAAGIYHTEFGNFDGEFASGLIGLRYTF